MTSQSKHWQVDEHRFVGCALAPVTLLVLLTYTYAVFGYGDASCWFKNCRRPNLNSANFLHCSACIYWPNIPFTCHLHYLLCSQAHWNAFIAVLLVSSFSHLSSTLLFTSLFLLLLFSDARIIVLLCKTSPQFRWTVAHVPVAATTFRALLSDFQSDQLLLREGHREVMLPLCFSANPLRPRNRFFEQNK